MFVPLYDVNALKHIKLQYVTLSLIAINVAVWLVTDLAGTDEFAGRAAMGLGYIPALLFDNRVLDPSLYIIPEDFTYLTYAFLHGDIWHLAGNMLFLWVFGDNVEDAMGHIKFLIFYLLSAAAAAWFHGFLDPSSTGPLIGASGAISGVVASYFLLHPRVRVWVLILWKIPVPVPAFIPLILWILQQFVMLVIDSESNISWAAHAGGILAGLVLTPVLKRWGVPLFDRTIVSPRAVAHKEAPPEAAAEPQKTTPHWGR
jgi:membrane associated rhomboid family serine protease